MIILTGCCMTLVFRPPSTFIKLSISKGSLPQVWKCANVSSLPKVKDLRPISLTPTLSKVAEHYVVYEHDKAAVLTRLDLDQFGCIPGSSTPHALINMLHDWTHAIDGTGNCVRVFVMDYKKAFDLIDHGLSIGVQPFSLADNERVKLANDCFSE